MFSSWSRTQRSTPRPAAGDSLTLRMESRVTRRCTRPASPATRLRKIATMSSPDTHLDSEESFPDPSRLDDGSFHLDLEHVAVARHHLVEHRTHDAAQE